MDVLNKIEEIRKQSPALDDYVNEKLKVIEARYAFSSSLSNFSITVDPAVMEELEELAVYAKGLIISNNHLENQQLSLCHHIPLAVEPKDPLEEVRTPESQYNYFLKESIIKNIQSLTRLPVPQPPNFNREVFNKFVSQDSRDMLSKVKVIEDKASLLNLLKSLENKRMDFLSEPHKTIYTSNLFYFQEYLASPTVGEDDKVVLNTIINRIKTMDISCEELEFFMDKYSTPIFNIDEDQDNTNKIHISEKDIKILDILSGDNVDNKLLFITIAGIIGLQKNESEVLLENMILEKKKAYNLAKLEREIVLPNSYTHLVNQQH